MSNIEKYFNKENSHKIFCCIINGEEVLLQCYYNIDFAIVEAYSWENPQDYENYIDDIHMVVGEHMFEDEVNDDVYFATKEDQDLLDSLIVQDDVYAYKSNEELKKIILILGVHVVNGSTESETGLLYYYAEYDDFSCYGDGWTYNAKVIDNAVIKDN